MLVLDFINVGNGDSILVREMEGERLRFSMLVDCGHDSLERDDHPPVEDPRSCRIFAGISCEVKVWRIWISWLSTHFHRDHDRWSGPGAGRPVTAGRAADPLCAPRRFRPAGPGRRQRPAQGSAERAAGVWTCTPAPCGGTETGSAGSRSSGGPDGVSPGLTDDLTHGPILFGEPALYPRQRAVYDAAFRGERERL